MYTGGTLPEVFVVLNKGQLDVSYLTEKAQSPRDDHLDSFLGDRKKVILKFKMMWTLQRDFWYVTLKLVKRVRENRFLIDINVEWIIYLIKLRRSRESYQFV